jgi:hypothetical protein
VQATALADHVFTPIAPIEGAGYTVEVVFSKREAAAFALQVLDAAGYAAEVERRA